MRVVRIVAMASRAIHSGLPVFIERGKPLFDNPFLLIRDFQLFAGRIGVVLMP